MSAANKSGRHNAAPRDGITYPRCLQGNRSRHHRSRRCVANTLGHFDSLGVEADGTVVVADLNDGLCVVRPDGEISYVRVPGPTPVDGGGVGYLRMPSSLATNICWGGEDMTTAYVTDAGESRLIAYEWPRRGLRLAFNL